MMRDKGISGGIDLASTNSLMLAADPDSAVFHRRSHSSLRGSKSNPRNAATPPFARAPSLRVSGHRCECVGGGGVFLSPVLFGIYFLEQMDLQGLLIYICK